MKKMVIDIDKVFEFYNIDDKYKDRCYECINNINANEKFKNSFDKIYEILYLKDFNKVKELWDIKDINELFTMNIDPFVTNIMIIIGYPIHIYNMNKYKLDNNQIELHKKRVKECFENDLIIRNSDGVRISQMLWATYFIRMKIIEVGRLQYDFIGIENKTPIVKIHIPKGSKLEIDLVNESIEKSKIELKRYFDIDKCKYICNSWLLSNQVYEIIDKDSNIAKFHDLFDIKDGEKCISDILNFVYGLNECNDYNLLSEETSIQRKIKKELISGKIFYLGLGVLRGVDF